MDIEILFDGLRKVATKKLIDGTATLTYGTLYKKSRQIHSMFKAQGITAGDRIGIAVTDEIEASILILTCFRLGVTVSLIDPGAKKSEATQIMNRLQLRALFLNQELEEIWSPDVPVRRTITRQKNKLISRLLGKKENQIGNATNYPDCLSAYEGTAEELPALKSSDHPALLLCTSGTTGLPKILQLSLQNLLAAAKTMSHQLGFTSEDRVLNLLPLTHYDGVISGLFTTFYHSATLVRLGPFTVSLLPDVFDAIHKYEATHLLLTPAIIGLMLRLGEEIQESFQTDHFRFVISVAASLPPKIWSDFQQITGKKIVNVYGLSETGNNLFAGPDEESYHIGSIGKPVDCRAAIIREDGTPVEPGETGELLLQGASVTSGYLGEPLETKVLHGISWFATGDLAYVDEAGLYWLMGRKKNIIIVGGRNVYPDEINNVLLSHPSVIEAATLGLPDDIWGERICSCVVTRNGVTGSDLIEYANVHLTDYKVPREIHILSELPKGRSGKVLLNELAKQLQQNAHATTNVALMDLEQEVVRLASESFRTPAEQLSLKTSPASCSRWDSVAHMDFVTNLESKFGMELLPREVIQITSIDAAVRIIRSKLMPGVQRS